MQSHFSRSRTIAIPASRRESFPSDPVARSPIAVTQVCLGREHILLLARLSAGTRLSPGGHRPQAVIVRLLLQETLRAAIEPEWVRSVGSLVERLRTHFGNVRRRTGHDLTGLATGFRRTAGSDSGLRRASELAPREATTLRLPIVDLVALDNYRCDILQATGLRISRSAVLRAAIDSFAFAFQL